MLLEKAGLLNGELISTAAVYGSRRKFGWKWKQFV